MKQIKAKIFVVFTPLFLTVALFFILNPAFASTTDGIIDSTYKYAWSENAGWINFGTTNGNIHVTASSLSGYALSENVGWINLGDILNDGLGNLSGYAWSENAGWINFAPTNGGVSIDSQGQFTGSALGENMGWIIFDCTTSACVKTDWRPITQSHHSGGHSNANILVIKNPLVIPIITSNSRPPIYNFGISTLKNGSRGEAVKELQRFLNAALNLGLVVDGKLGPKTIAVIKKWQKDNGLVADGLVGPKTKAKMNGV